MGDLIFDSRYMSFAPWAALCAMILLFICIYNFHKQKEIEFSTDPKRKDVARGFIFIETTIFASISIIGFVGLAKTTIDVYSFEYDNPKFEYCGIVTDFLSEEKYGLIYVGSRRYFYNKSGLSANYSGFSLGSPMRVGQNICVSSDGEFIRRISILK